MTLQKRIDDKIAEVEKTAEGRAFFARGYTIAHTGGGCMAWEIKLPDGFIWITDATGCDVVDHPDGWIACFRLDSDPEVEQDINIPDNATAEECIAKVDLFISTREY